MANKSELLLFSKTSVQPLFYDVFRCFRIFFRFQTSLMTILDVFFRCNHRNDFFTTISGGCNSRCKRSSSTILRPGLGRWVGGYGVPVSPPGPREVWECSPPPCRYQCHGDRAKVTKVGEVIPISVWYYGGTATFRVTRKISALRATFF